MKFLLLSISVVCALNLSLEAQVTTAKDEISMAEYRVVQIKAIDRERRITRRVTRTTEYLDNQSKAVKLREKTILEFIQPYKWREIKETFYDKHTYIEGLFDGKVIYVRKDNDPWEKGHGWTFATVWALGGVKTDRYRHLPNVDFEGGKAEFYELIATRTGVRCPLNGCAEFTYHETFSSWHSSDGKLLKLVKESDNYHRTGIRRETTLYEYDPKGLIIEAPMK